MKSIVLEGGGTKGIAYVGCLQALQELNYNFDNVVGTSAGAITAALLYLGYSPEEIKNILTGQGDVEPLVFSEFLDIPDSFSKEDISNSVTYRLLNKSKIRFLPWTWRDRILLFFIRTLMNLKFYRLLFSFVERGGFYKGLAIEDWMVKCIDRKLSYSGRCTWGEIDRIRKGAADYMNVTFVAADTTAQRILELNPQNCPDLPLYEAVRMTCSIPGVWQEVIWKKSFGLYKGEDISGHHIVDGALISNFPIKIVEGEFVGFLLDEENSHDNYKFEESKSALSIVNESVILSRVSRWANTMMKHCDGEYIEEHKDSVCKIPCKGASTLDFSMTPDTVEKLIALGYESTMAHFDK